MTEMGYYVEVPRNKGKADEILAGELMVPASGDPSNPLDQFDPSNEWKYTEGGYRAMEVPCPAQFSDIPEDAALIVVCDNGWMEAAGFAYDEREFRAMTDPSDPRPRRYLLMSMGRMRCC